FPAASKDRREITFAVEPTPQGTTGALTEISLGSGAGTSTPDSRRRASDASPSDSDRALSRRHRRTVRRPSQRRIRSFTPTGNWLTPPPPPPTSPTTLP